FENLTSYSRGINGVMIDVAGGLPLTALAGIFGGAGLKTGAGGEPAQWADAPRPLLSIRPGAGANGTDRVTLTWPDGAIRDAWLRVTIPATNPGLAAPDVFYFGNLVGDAADGGAPAVNVTDVASTRAHAGSPSPTATSPYD